jgi:hypothetical protein
VKEVMIEKQYDMSTPTVNGGVAIEKYSLKLREQIAD